MSTNQLHELTTVSICGSKWAQPHIICPWWHEAYTWDKTITWSFHLNMPFISPLKAVYHCNPNRSYIILCLEWKVLLYQGVSSLNWPQGGAAVLFQGPEWLHTFHSSIVKPPQCSAFACTWSHTCFSFCFFSWRYFSQPKGNFFFTLRNFILVFLIPFL